MYKQCTTNRTIARQRELEAGILEVLGHRRFDDISVVDLCHFMGIPRKAFYRYFNGKEGALYALIDHTLDDSLDELILLKENASNPEVTLTTFFSFWLNKKELLDALAHNDLSGILLQRAINYSISNSYLSSLIFPKRLEETRDYVAVFFISGIMSLVIQWHVKHFDMSPQEMARTAVHFIYHPELTLKS